MMKRKNNFGSLMHNYAPQPRVFNIRQWPMTFSNVKCKIIHKCQLNRIILQIWDLTPKKSCYLGKRCTFLFCCVFAILQQLQEFILVALGMLPISCIHQHGLVAHAYSKHLSHFPCCK